MTHTDKHSTMGPELNGWAEDGGNAEGNLELREAGGLGRRWPLFTEEAVSRVSRATSGRERKKACQTGGNTMCKGSELD